MKKMIKNGLKFLKKNQNFFGFEEYEDINKEIEDKEDVQNNSIIMNKAKILTANMNDIINIENIVNIHTLSKKESAKIDKNNLRNKKI